MELHLPGSRLSGSEFNISRKKWFTGLKKGITRDTQRLRQITANQEAGYYSGPTFVENDSQVGNPLLKDDLQKLTLC